MRAIIGMLLSLTLVGCTADQDSNDTGAVDSAVAYAGGAQLADAQNAGTDDADANADSSDDNSDITDDEREPFDEDEAEQKARDQVADETYRDVGMPYGCTDDCSGHEAGFRWAARREDGTGGYSNSPSFQQGKQAYEDAVSERVDQMRENYENGDDPDD